MPFAEVWMDLENVIQSELGQKEKTSYHILIDIYSTSLVAQLVKNLPAMQETWV